jgi:hypothetical protein
MSTLPDSTLQKASLSSALATIFRGKLCDTLFHDRRPLTFAKGSAIYEAGDDRRTFFFVRRGVVKVGALTDDGREVIYDLRKEGDVVGELCACETTRRDYAIALEPAEVIAVPYEDILDSLQRIDLRCRKCWTSFAGRWRVRTTKRVCSRQGERSSGSSKSCCGLRSSSAALAVTWSRLTHT